MKNNKSKKLFIILIIVIVLILIVGVAYAMLATDMFKSDKELFFKYASQILENENGFADNKLKQYDEKKQNSVYKNEGKFSVNINSSSLSEKDLNNVNNFNISYEGNTDNINNQVEELIKINYNDEVNFPINYKKIDNTHAIKLSEISKRYFLIKQEDVGNLISKLNGSESVANQAKNAQIILSIQEAKENVAIKVSEIMTQYYDEKTEEEPEKSLIEMLLEEEYESDGVTIDAESDEDDGGIITIVSKTDPTYAEIGKVSVKGSIQWDSEYGTYSNGTKTGSSDNLTNQKEFDWSSIELTKEEKSKLKDTYLTVIKENIDNSNFTKITTTESQGYSLELSNQEFKEIIIKLLETLKDDETFLNKFNKIFDTNIQSSGIENIINNINQTETDEGKIIITVYQNQDKLNKIEIQYNEDIKFSISKTSSDDDVVYNIDIESQSYSINFNMRVSGLQNMEQVEEYYKISLNAMGESYSYNIENKINFSVDNLDINDFEDDECIDLGSLKSDRLIKVLQTVGNGIEKANTKKMQDSQMDGQNPLISMIPGLNNLMTLYNSTNIVEMDKQQTDEKEDKEDSEDKEEQQNNNNTTSSSNLVSDMEKLSKESFNEKFKQYEGESVKGPTVKSLIMQVIANNMIDDGRTIEVTGDIKLTGTSVPDSIEASKLYKVKCSTDAEGYVNKVDITLKN